MNRAPLLSIFSLVLAPLGVVETGAAQSSRPASRPAQVTTVPGLVEAIRAREKAVRSVELSMRTRGSFPGEEPFETQGTLRVLSTTHCHTQMSVRFGDEITTEFETVKTPEGVMMREKDPAQGEVFVRMEGDLLTDLDAASQVLGLGAFDGPGAEMAHGPLGSIMLEDLSQQFDLSLSGPSLVGEFECWTVSGDRRKGEEDEVFGVAERVEVLVRRADLALIRMTQFGGGQALVDVEITSLKLDLTLEPTSFGIALPSGARVVDALDHPPARAQIDQIFAEAAAKGWRRGQPVGGSPESQPTSRENR